MVWLPWCKVGRDILVILAVEVKSWVSFKSLVKVSRNLFEQAAKLELLFYGAHHPSNNSDGSPNDGLGRWCSDQKMGSLNWCSHISHGHFSWWFLAGFISSFQQADQSPTAETASSCRGTSWHLHASQGCGVQRGAIRLTNLRGWMFVTRPWEKCIETPTKIDKCVEIYWVLSIDDICQTDFQVSHFSIFLGGTLIRRTFGRCLNLQFRPLTAPAVLSKSSTACTSSCPKGACTAGECSWREMTKRNGDFLPAKNGMIPSGSQTWQQLSQQQLAFCTVATVAVTALKHTLWRHYQPCQKDLITGKSK